MGDDDDEWNEEGEEEEEHDPDEVSTVSSVAASSLGVGWPCARGRSRERKPTPATTSKGDKSKDLKKGSSGHDGGNHPNDSSSVCGPLRSADHDECTHKKGKKEKEAKKDSSGHDGGVHPNDSSSVGGARRPTDHDEGTHEKNKKAHKPDPPDDPPASSGTSSDSDNSEVNPLPPARAPSTERKRRTKEALKVEVPSFPTIAKLAAYKLTMLENVVCASGREDHQNVAKWILHVERKGTTLKDLADPGAGFSAKSLQPSHQVRRES